MTIPDDLTPSPPDLVDRTFTADRPSQLWVADSHGSLLIEFPN